MLISLSNERKAGDQPLGRETPSTARCRAGTAGMTGEWVGRRRALGLGRMAEAMLRPGPLRLLPLLLRGDYTCNRLIYAEEYSAYQPGLLECQTDETLRHFRTYRREALHFLAIQLSGDPL